MGVRWRQGHLEPEPEPGEMPATNKHPSFNNVPLPLSVEHPKAPSITRPPVAFQATSLTHSLSLLQLLPLLQPYLLSPAVIVKTLQSVHKKSQS